MNRTVLKFTEKSPLLTESQIKILAEIGIASGQITLGTMVLPFVVPGLDRAKLPVIALGLVATASIWSFSVLLARKIKL